MRKLLHFISFIFVAGLSFWGGMRFRDHLPNQAHPAKAMSADGGNDTQSSMDRKSKKKPASFESKTRFAILDERVSDDNLRIERHTAESSWLETQLRTISSQENLLRTVKSLELDAQWKLYADAAASRLAETIDVRMEPNTNIVTVTAYSNNSLEASELANGVRESYENYRTASVEERLHRMSQNTDALINEQKEAIEKLTAISGEHPDLDLKKAELDKLLDSRIRQKLEDAVLRKPIEVLEVASPQAPE